MTQTAKARVFMSGRSQHVTIPAEYRFKSAEVSIRRDPKTGDIVLSEGPGTWRDVFAALDAAVVPESFLSDAERSRKPPIRRPALEELLDHGSAAPERRR